MMTHRRFPHPRLFGRLSLMAFFFAASAMAEIDHSKTVVVLPFQAAVEAKPGFLDAARGSVVAYLKDKKTFATVLAPDTADGAKTANLELSGNLVEFKAGNMATRVMVGMGSGRASAAIEFTLKDLQSGAVLFKKVIKEKASVWSNSASSAAQRLELPDKIAGAFVKELEGKAK